jgi:hypothetical protein
MALIPKSNIATGNTILASDITNIINSLNETGSYTVIATGSFSGSFTGLANSSSYAVSSSYALSGSHTINAQTASLANNIPFTGITSLPSSLKGYGGFGGISEVKNIITGIGQVVSVSTLTNGAFYPIDATSGTVTYEADVPGGGTTYGFEITFFAVDATQDISFSPSGSITIICSGSLSTPKLKGTGAKATLKYISLNTWALFGDIKP